LALAALAVLFGLWSADLRQVGSLPKKTHIADRDPALRKLKSAQRSKAVPLAAGCALTALTLAQPAVSVLVRAIQHVAKRGFDAFADYDASQALFVVVWVLILGLSMSTIRICWMLHGRIKDFRTST